jgi:hypothetical protein
VKLARGASVGVNVGVLVRVGVALGLGEIVQVGLAVCVAVMVAVWVWLGKIVRVVVGNTGDIEPQPTIPQVKRSRMLPILIRSLARDDGCWSDIKE